jgi:predicted metal-dependent hydrolase
MRVKSDGIIQITANKNVPTSVIENFFRSKKFWIQKALKRTALRENFFHYNENLKYENGENFLYLGNKINIFVIPDEKNYISFDDENLYIYIKETEKDEIFKIKQNLFNKWIQNQAKRIFLEIAQDVYIKYFQNLNIPMPIIKTKRMKSRWGSCIPSKKIIAINFSLIKTTKDCIKYILIHEFSHFFHKGHTKKFYNFVENIMPNYKIFEKNLKNLNF